MGSTFFAYRDSLFLLLWTGKEFTFYHSSYHILLSLVSRDFLYYIGDIRHPSYLSTKSILSRKKRSRILGEYGSP